MKNNKFVQQGKLTKSGWLSIVAFLLVAVLALSVALGLVVKSGKEKKGTEELSVGGGMVLPEETEGDGISLTSTVIPKEQYGEYGIMPIALSGQTVTATVKDTSGSAPATLQYVTFELAWKSSNSARLSDYVSMSTTDTTATLTCLKPFSTQIVLNVKSALVPEKTASVTLDYAKQLTGYKMKATTKLFPAISPASSFSSFSVTEGASISFHMPNGTTKAVTTGTGSWCYPYFYFPTDEVTWGEGTVENSITSLSVKLKYSDSFLSHYSQFSYANTLTVSDKITTFSGSSDLALWTMLFKMACGGETDQTSKHYVEQYLGNAALVFGTGGVTYLNSFLSTLSSEENPIEATLFFNLQYGAVTYNFYLDPEVEPILVNSVDVDKSNITFFK